jgi:hypothetical protein
VVRMMEEKYKPEAMMLPTRADGLPVRPWYHRAVLVERVGGYLLYYAPQC